MQLPRQTGREEFLSASEAVSFAGKLVCLCLFINPLCGITLQKKKNQPSVRIVFVPFWKKKS